MMLVDVKFFIMIKTSTLTRRMLISMLDMEMKMSLLGSCITDDGDADHADCNDARDVDGVAAGDHDGDVMVLLLVIMMVM